MHCFQSWFYSLPDTIQAAWITTYGTCLAAVLTVIGAWIVLFTQLKQDRTKRKEDRAVELKKELYSDSIASMSLIVTNLVNWANLKSDEKEIAKIQSENSAKILRLHLVCNEEIIVKLAELNDIWLETFLSIGEQKLLIQHDLIPEDKKVDATFAMLLQAASTNKKLIPLASEIIILLRKDLEHPFTDENAYREAMNDSVNRNYNTLTTWIDKLRKQLN